MKIIIKCENCGNEVEVLPVTLGNVAYLGQNLRNNGFDIDSVNIDVELLEDEVNDSANVETKLREIRIDCKKCGNYICLDCD